MKHKRLRTWAVFTSNGIQQCGSDAWFELDGRLNFSHQWSAAYKKLQSLRVNVHKSWDGFLFYKGKSISDAKECSL